MGVFFLLKILKKEKKSDLLNMLILTVLGALAFYLISASSYRM
jgi:hypothetical protein